MEIHGAAVNVNWLFQQFNCIINTIIMDNNSSTKNVLKRQYKDLEAKAREEGVS